MPCDDIGDEYKLKKCKYDRGIPLDTTEMEYRKRRKKGYVYPSNILGIYQMFKVRRMFKLRHSNIYI